MQCNQCQTAKTNPKSGLYSFKCVDCCSRLVLKTRPDKRQASVMLAAIARFPNSPGRAEILESVNLNLAKRR